MVRRDNSINPDEMLVAGEMSDVDIHIKGMLYGDPGSGKTWAASTAPDCLILLTEQNGVTSIRASNSKARIVHCPDIHVVRKYLAAAMRDELREYGIRTIVVDSLTEVQRQFKDEILAQKGGGDALFSQPDWGKLQEKMRQFMRTLRVVPYHVVCTALAEATIDNGSGTRYVLPLFEGKKFAPTISQYFSFVGYMVKKETVAEDGERAVLHRAMLSGGQNYITKPAHPMSGVLEVNISDWFNTIIDSKKAKKAITKKSKE